MVTRTLTSADFDRVHAAFVDAFSDYVVPLRPERDRLEEMVVRRGYVPEVSPAVFEGDRIVAFTLNGVRGKSGYDTGTGVVPSHRRRGLARDVMLQSFDLLRGRGCDNYVLEVIDTNMSAVALYRALGFEQTRALQSWTFDGRERRAEPLTEDGTLDLVETMAAHRDMEPSWQNSIESIRSARDRFVVLGDAEGCAVVFPQSGDLAHLVVRRDQRRRGVGTRLLLAAAALAGKPLRIMNADEADPGMAAFLARAGASRFVRQLEMVKAV